MQGKNHNLMRANKSFENVAEFIYLEMAVTTENCIHEEKQSRLNLGTTRYHSIQNLPSRNLKIKAYYKKL
jgi:hypothetical protein